MTLIQFIKNLLKIMWSVYLNHSILILVYKDLVKAKHFTLRILMELYLK